MFFFALEERRRAPLGFFICSNYCGLLGERLNCGAKGVVHGRISERDWRSFPLSCMLLIAVISGSLCVSVGQRGIACIQAWCSEWKER